MRRELLTLGLGSLTLYLGIKASQLPNSPTLDPSQLPTDSGLGFGGPGSSSDKIARTRGSIADVLSGDARRRGGIWWDYGRDSSVGGKLGGLWRTTVFVPTDEAILRLERKPHLSAKGEEESEGSMRLNIEKFLSSHIIPSDIGLPSVLPFQTLAGNRVEVKRGLKEGEFRVVPGDIEVVGVTEASNGKIIYIDGVIGKS